MICVYEANCSDFSGNGLGVLTPSDCSVTETLNGEWELTLTHPLDKLGKWQRLTEGRILTAPVPASSTPRVNLITQSAGTDIYKVSTQSGTLRLRSGPGTSYKILKSYKKNTEVVLIQKTSSSWYEVTCPDGKRGYMSTEYLTYVEYSGGKVHYYDAQIGKEVDIVNRNNRSSTLDIFARVDDLDVPNKVMNAVLIKKRRKTK